MVFIFGLFFLFSLFSTTTIAVNNPCSYQVCVATPAVSPSIEPTADIEASPGPPSCPVLLGTLAEAEIWRQEYYAGEMGSLSKNNWKADFGRNDGQPGCDGLVDLIDREIWRQRYFNNL